MTLQLHLKKSHTLCVNLLNYKEFLLTVVIICFEVITINKVTGGALLCSFEHHDVEYSFMAHITSLQHRKRILLAGKN